MLLCCALSSGLLAGFTDTPSTANGLPFLDFQRMLAFLPIFYLGMLAATPEHFACRALYSFPFTLSFSCFVPETTGP